MAAWILTMIVVMMTINTAARCICCWAVLLE
uniref:Uncharacterized protein n=1 Tax=Setaria italica TaxID=4555 RepID=K3Y3Y5_SETIT